MASAASTMTLPIAPLNRRRLTRGGVDERSSVHHDAGDAGPAARDAGTDAGGDSTQLPPHEALRRDGDDAEGARCRAHPARGDLPEEQVATLALRFQAYGEDAALVRAESRDQPAVHLRPGAQRLIHRIHDRAGLRLLPARLGR